MFCGNCGKEMADSNAFCPSCGKKVGAVSGTPPAARSDRPTLQLALPSQALSLGFIIILAGAIMMLIALAFDWYTVNYTGHSLNNWSLDFNNLTNSNDLEILELVWAGAALPLILMIVFASVTILSVIFSIVSGQYFKKLWGWLGVLSVVVLIVNLVYLLVTALTEESEYYPDVTGYITPHVGWVLAIIGAVGIGIGSRKV